MTTMEDSKKRPEIEPLFYEKGEKYEITINPSNEKQNVSYHKSRRVDKLYEEENRLQKTFRDCNRYLREYLKPYGEYKLIWEIGECQMCNGSNGKEPSDGYPRWHLHGYYTINDPIGWLSEGMIGIARHIGRVQLNKSKFVTSTKGKKNYDREKYWEDYCNKQKHLVQEYCKMHRVPYEITQDTSTNLIINDKVSEYYQLIDSEESS